MQSPLHLVSQCNVLYIIILKMWTCGMYMNTSILYIPNMCVCVCEIMWIYQCDHDIPWCYYNLLCTSFLPREYIEYMWHWSIVAQVRANAAPCSLRASNSCAAKDSSALHQVQFDAVASRTRTVTRLQTMDTYRDYAAFWCRKWYVVSSCQFPMLPIPRYPPVDRGWKKWISTDLCLGLRHCRSPR